MRTATAYAGGALVVAAAGVLGWWQARPALPTSTAVREGVLDASLAVLRREQEVPPRKLPEPGAQLPLPSPAPAALPPKAGPLEALLAEARMALEEEDLNRFAKAFFELLDAGEPAYGAVLALLPEFLARKDALLENPRNHPADVAFYLGTMGRMPALGGLLDAILSRDGEPDGVTPLALHLYEGGAICSLPRERQVAALLSLVRQGDSPGQANGVTQQRAARILMSGLKASEALPELERIVMRGTTGRQQPLLDAIASLGGGEAMASFRRLLKQSKDQNLRRAASSTLGMMK